VSGEVCGEDGRVTVGEKTARMAKRPPRTGVCVIRVEAQEASFLITVRRNSDIGGRSVEAKTTYSQVEPALAQVRRFLERFMGSTPRISAGREPHP
jgi:hypothetical protein